MKTLQKTNAGLSKEKVDAFLIPVNEGISFEISRKGQINSFELHSNEFAKLTEKDLKRGRFWKGIHEEDLESVKKAFFQQIRKRNPYFHIEFRFSISERNFVQISVNVLLDFTNRRFKKAKVFAQKVNDTNEYDSQKRKKKEMYRIISEYSKDVICLHANDGTYLYVSPSVEELLGYKPSELIGRKSTHFFYLDKPEVSEKNSKKKAKKNKTIYNKEFRFKTKKGDYVWVESATRKIVDEQGNKLYTISFYKNITHQKIKHAELLKAKQEAEFASKEKMSFLSTISHEVRNPLNAILGFTELLINGSAHNDLTEKLTLLKASGKNLQKLVNDFLDFGNANKENTKPEIQEEKVKEIKVLQKPKTNKLNVLLESISEGNTSLKQSLLRLHINNLKEIKENFPRLIEEKNNKKAKELLLKTISTVDGLKIKKLKNLLNSSLKHMEQSETVLSIKHSIAEICDEVILQLNEIIENE